MVPPPTRSTLFPYTTLFRSVGQGQGLRHLRPDRPLARDRRRNAQRDRKSTRLNSSHVEISYAVFCLKKKKQHTYNLTGNYVHHQHIFDVILEYHTSARAHFS